MIVILKENPDRRQLEFLTGWLQKQQIGIHISEGAHQTVLGLVGDATRLDIDMLKQMEIVEDVKRVQEPFKKANRKFHPLDTVIQVGSARIGGGGVSIIAGPCSVESPEQIALVARGIKDAGADLLRGGAFKPRSSPYSFQGLRGEGIKMLVAAGREVGLPIVTEIMDLSNLDLFAEVDVIQVGARNMQNFELLKELGHSRKPILLKRGLANTYEELLMSAEYIMVSGNENILLCERGIRTFETYTRNTLDITAVPALQTLSHLPIVIDPSHAAGKASFVPALTMAAVAAGADALMIEVHNDPPHALSDGAQSLTIPAFAKLANQIRQLESTLVEEKN
ncbi:MAG TPA: 3-deoxy-7-phosphoheptulonate synthase [Lentisphaeria bacterium]|nr:3-deoxy-7-phosphoheptulonate synthase [Lentisphaerota bacterium]OQC15283.1 MAG: Phospho-2-dehydro-3-deoxyheptonate aldolase [Lentisphaerae bacterium ADurb.Bin082]HPY89737.1 3-deoxy-7-phosphoheptulonate synthase [Lentisphaeria bacterium]HQC52710.1 3-deoxy-7-phosphoheptulonate synthase [Lentisphaeria bacterium]